MSVVGVKDFVDKQQNLAEQAFRSLWGVFEKEAREVSGQQGGDLCGSLERDGESPVLREPVSAELENGSRGELSCK